VLHISLISNGNGEFNSANADTIDADISRITGRLNIRQGIGLWSFHI